MNTLRLRPILESRLCIGYLPHKPIPESRLCIGYRPYKPMLESTLQIRYLPHKPILGDRLTGNMPYSAPIPQTRLYRVNAPGGFHLPRKTPYAVSNL